MKKILCLVLAFAAMTSLFACGGSGSGSGGQGSASVPDPRSEPDESAGAESGGDPEPGEVSAEVSESSEPVSQEESVSDDELVSQEESVPDDEPVSQEESVSVPDKKEYIDGKKLIVFGDSITALGSWGRTAAEELNMYFFNGAMGGITSAQGITRFPAYVAGHGADFVTLLFGMNDLIMESAGKPRVTPEQFEKNLTELVKMVRDCGAEPILLTANPLDPDKFWAAQGQSKAMYESVGGDPLAWEEVYNDVTRKVAAETGAYLIDMFAACDGVPYNRLLRDGIHLADAGNKIFAETLAEWFGSRFDRDPNAEKVSEYGDLTDVSVQGGRASLYSDEPDGWYTVDPLLMNIEKSDGAINISNTNGLWPYAESLPEKPVSVSFSDGYLNYDISTVGVSTSIILFFNGSTPSAYTEGTYVSINSKIGAKCNEVGDITPGQDLKGRIELSKLGISAQNVKDGRLIITGIKVYAAGSANKPVVLRELSVSEG